jgi:Ca2+-binding RTX toxin-like protein
VVLLPVALIIAAAWPAASHAFVACSFSSGTVSVVMTAEDDGVELQRFGPQVAVVAGGGGEYDDGTGVLVACAGGTPTVNNTDQIVIEGAATATDQDLAVNLADGPLAPGATAEADGSSEIEIRANLPGGSSDARVEGTSGPDALHFGRTAAGARGGNLNATEASPDVDVEFSALDTLRVAGGEGPDSISAHGGPGLPLPLAARRFLADGGGGNDVLVGDTGRNLFFGDVGRDVLIGGPRRDFLEPASGRDVVIAKKGRDFVLALDGKRDRIRCGPGRDQAVLDRRDRQRGCDRAARLPNRRPR